MWFGHKLLVEESCVRSNLGITVSAAYYPSCRRCNQQANQCIIASALFNCFADGLQRVHRNGHVDRLKHIALLSPTRTFKDSNFTYEGYSLYGRFLFEGKLNRLVRLYSSMMQYFPGHCFYGLFEIRTQWADGGLKSQKISLPVFLLLVVYCLGSRFYKSLVVVNQELLVP
jgi:hypothetical protein